MARDGFQLIQATVANWESLEGVEDVSVVEEWVGNSFERRFIAEVSIRGEEPVYLRLTLLDPTEEAESIDGYDELDDDHLEEQAEALFQRVVFARGQAVPWRAESWQ